MSGPHDPEKWEPVFGEDHAAKESPNDLARELLAQSLVAWRVAGSVERARDGALVIGASRKDIRIDRAPPHLMFRWMVTVDGRMIENLHVEQAERALALAAAIKELQEAA